MLRIYMLPPRGLASLLVSEAEAYAQKPARDEAEPTRDRFGFCSSGEPGDLVPDKGGE